MSFNPKREARPSQTFLVPCHSQSVVCFNPKREARPSQTRRQSPRYPARPHGFNPKREARPSQTGRMTPSSRAIPSSFQSQTGSQALSDICISCEAIYQKVVSIPNGKPGPLRRSLSPPLAYFPASFNPKREARPSQTLHRERQRTGLSGFNPKREARPSQTFQWSGSQSPCLRVSIPNGKPGPLRHRPANYR